MEKSVSIDIWVMGVRDNGYDLVKENVVSVGMFYTNRHMVYVFNGSGADVAVYCPLVYNIPKSEALRIAVFAVEHGGSFVEKDIFNW